MRQTVALELPALRGRPGYLALDGEPIYGVLHLPAQAACSRVGAILCPPFGWDELGAHRSLRALAGTLAQAGHPALRFDFPGTGDSGGSPRDPRRLEAWTACVDAAAASLRDASGCERIVAIGIGLGGMVACQAVALGAAVDDLMLWSVPSRGSLLVREMRAFARMADAELVDTGLAREYPPPLEDEALSRSGDLNVAGFVVTAETLADLTALDLAELPVPDAARRRVLLLGRDTLPPDRRMREHLERSGVALTVAPGPGYDTMMVDPHLAQIPWELIASAVQWVGEGDLAEVAAPSGGPEIGAGLAESVELRCDTELVREAPFEFDFRGEQLAGVLTEPVSAGEQDLCVVLLNAGAVRHIGPQRMWVEAARRWAALGVPTLRLDIAGVGDSDGDGRPYARRGALQRAEFADQVIAAFDELERRGLPNRFLTGGVCSGAYWGLHAALLDERVRGLLLFNLLAFHWTPELGAVRDSRRARAMLHERELKAMVRIIATDRWRITRMALTKLRQLRTMRHHQRLTAQLAGEVVAVLDELRDRGVQVTLCLSFNEPLFEDLAADGLTERLAEWPNLRLERIPTMEHVFRSPETQRWAHASLDEALAQTLAADLAGRTHG
jgi:pimeloyl-ACP methyl ester carboxylesterase